MSAVGRWFRRVFSGKAKQDLQPTASYDAARTTQTNRNRWKRADGASPIAANDPETRRILRNRSRYEAENNSYTSGLISDRANETIGTGPRLQVALPDSYFDPDFQRTVQVEDAERMARVVEQKWCEWWRLTKQLDKMLVIDKSDTREGEIFAHKFLNTGLPLDGVQLDVRLYEADQVATPDLAAEDENAVDGIRFDDNGNPIEYHVLWRHPGDVLRWSGIFQDRDAYDRIPARQMIHFFTPSRAGQARGIPTLTPSLELGSILRRYTEASALNAEAQSRIVGVVKNADSTGLEEGDEEKGGKEIEFNGVSLMELDAGQEAQPFSVSHPAPAYGEFKGELLTEYGRPMNAPRNVSRGSSADYNYSSGRLDQQQWQRSIKIRRKRYETAYCDNLFAEWLRYALLIPGYLPTGLPPVAFWEHAWRWDGFVSIDPVKDATAATQRVQNGTSNLDLECGELGKDWKEVQDQRLREEAREMRQRQKLGLGPKVQPQQSPAPQPVRPNGQDEEDEGAEESQ